ncbi:dedicator of cytokinesis protein 9 isoform X1 [Lutzomyia longipalpis]|uniref:dedicator of cytokinesis protein 9 isoform X1 n=1 Tax=Lutzomyia longipalpis TaxID=7200 RepID=UPI0024834DFB|nr:dedicator of cytokinesis protein 9 isoform X1 [Lutzomyia longipalpis]
MAMKMTERKFTKGLHKPGMALKLRETVCQVVRESSVLNKPVLVEPIDFESFMVKNKTLIQNDPQRELLLYPNDDVSEIIQPRNYRTVTSGIPEVINHENGSIEASSTCHQSPKTENVNGNSGKMEMGGGCQPPLLTRQAIRTYKSDNRLIQYKYSSYSGLSQDLPRQISVADEFREEVYEVDADLDRIDEQMTRSQADTITKQGYLLKGPDTTSDRMFAHIGAKSFKKRYCYLRQEVDGTYILEVHKDERQGEAKTTIVMDFCTEVIQNPKRGRLCFELKMTAGHKSFTFAAENESDLQDWLTKLQSILQQNKLQEDKRAASLERAPSDSQQTTAFGTLKGLEQSMNPQLIKYSRETDMSIAQARKDGRRKLFASYQLPSHVSKIASQPETCEPYKEQFGQRILLKCESLKFRLQAPTEDGEALNQVEPYITSLALYDAKAGRKLTENFYFDLNHENIRDVLQPGTPKASPEGGGGAVNGSTKHNGTAAGGDVLDKVPNEWLLYPREAIMSVTSPNPDIFLVVKIDKILQGGINQSTEPYLKANKDPKVGCKVQRSIRAYSQKIGHFRMPFAWAARPLFRLYSSDLDVAIDFPAIYRQEGNKLRDEELLKLLAEYRKPDKFSKLTVIPGWLKIHIEPITELPKNCLSTTLAPLKPFPVPPVKEVTQEISEFSGVGERDAHPFANFQNHLFVYPLSLNFDSQKLFSRARNIAVVIELRDSDAEGAKGLSCIYGRPGQGRFVSQVSCPVLHHNTCPTWYEEVKLKLPLHITTQHHILFSFVHVSCDLGKKKENNSFETPVGYAWLPLLMKGKINVEEQMIPVAATLPTGYLAIQPLGLGKGQNAGPEIQWIDNQKPLFAVTFRLDSTVLTTDQHLHNLFAHAERLLEQAKPSAIPAESETCKILKAAHAVHATTVITFLPTILNQLFMVLVNTSSEEIGLNIIRLLVNLIHMVAEEAGRKELLLAYVKYVFHAPSFGGKLSAGSSPSARNTVHCELCRHLPKLLHPNNTDFLIVNKFMRYSGIFFDIIIKSMAQHLLSTGRIKMTRNERFPKEFHTSLESLFQVLIPYIISRHKDLIAETQALNRSLSVFVKRCLTFMDRGFVFKLTRLYMDRFSPGDPRTLQEFKFSFLQEVCSHEHYVPLNLPFILSPKNRPDILQHFTLTEEYCRQHFLAGLLLQEVKSALNEVANTRRMALGTLKELLAKHDLDDRYAGKGQISRIAMIYIPWMGIVLENLHRIGDGNEKSGHFKGDSNRISTSSSYVFSRDTSGLNGIANNSTASTPKARNRLTLHVENPSPFRASLHLRDTTYFAAIAGQNLTNGHSTTSLDSECSSLSQDTTVIRNVENSSDSSSKKGHNRSISVTQPSAMPRCDKFTPSETKDMLICFLFVVKHIAQEQMTTWWQNCTESETIGFFTILEMCLVHFRYVGKKNIVLQDPVREARSHRAAKASTLPARMQPPNGEVLSHETGTMTHGNRENLVEETVRSQQALIESNMATEIGMIILDCMGLYTVQFRNSIMDSGVLPKLAQVYLRFLQLGQSEALSMHVFSALRAFINNFSPALFRGTSVMCGQLVYELLKCCDSRLANVRQESCAVLYLLMRSNFEFSGRKALTRVHLQVIISVSQMIGNVIGLNNARFQESLSLINSYASSDKAMKGTGFPLEVKDLTKRVRTVLMATAQMQAHQMDPERLLELQLSLANSYASTPELRHTWLVTMARNHEQHGNISEAACCNLHIAALMAEYLKLKGSGFISKGAESFAKISRNIPRDERGLKLDSGTQDSQYTEQMLLDQLKECADYLDRAERFECLGELYRLIIPIQENRRNYYDLAHGYEHLANVYNKIIEVNKSGRRLLGRFYRVAFFGQLYFEDDNGIEYVYKEPKLTSLSEISERLHKQYKDKFGSDVVKMIMDSCPVDANELDPKMAYIQVTHVIPYFCKDELDDRQNEFEQNHDVDSFMYETPFTKNGSARGNVEDQWKRRTVLTTQYSFPYVLTRIPVKSRQVTELTPIEVAVDEMQNRVAELEEVVLPPIDLKKLQLRLQGSVAVTVNAGPLAYASAFLDPKTNEKYPYERVEDLREVYRDFMRVCYTALQINGRLIMSDQKDYHKELERNYQNLCSALTDLLDESFFPSDETNSAHRTSLALFSAISGAPNNSSSA